MQYVKFPARCTDQGPDPQTKAWMLARYGGFLEVLPGADQLAAVAATWQDEGRTLHAIHDDSSRTDGALGADIPVATLATFEAGLNAGGLSDIPCTLIADVTVRATHQGQGLTRRLMQSVMDDASDRGVPLMALHAAHPALYARFGFAPAIRSMSVDVACSRFSLLRSPTGVVHEADPQQADDVARTVAAARSPFDFGALSIASSTPGRVLRGDDVGHRCLIHADDSGNVDGVLTYAFQGWTPQEQILKVVSEAYSTVNAHAALWQTIASTGIASTVHATDVRLDDPLPWMLSDRAAWRVTSLGDGLSLRILDSAQALELRGYSGPDSELAIEVTDQTGPAAGTQMVRVAEGRAQVEKTARPADVTLDAKELAAIFLGSTRTSTLLEAGLVTASRDAADALDSLLRWPVEASSPLHF